MCRTCPHWQVNQVRVDFGVRFAPCALKPDKIVHQDSGRDDGTMVPVEQTYVCSETYVCKSYAGKA